MKENMYELLKQYPPSLTEIVETIHKLDDWRRTDSDSELSKNRKKCNIKFIEYNKKKLEEARIVYDNFASSIFEAYDEKCNPKFIHFILPGMRTALDEYCNLIRKRVLHYMIGRKGICKIFENLCEKKGLSPFQRKLYEEGEELEKEILHVKLKLAVEVESFKRNFENIMFEREHYGDIGGIPHHYNFSLFKTFVEIRRREDIDDLETGYMKKIAYSRYY
jgi:hypothetical protein